MILVECSCKCFFTIKKDSLSREYIHCPNCRQAIELIENRTIEELSNTLSNKGISISSIPDNAKIIVKFDL